MATEKISRFWFFYAAGWLAYGVCLAAVFLGFGIKFDLRLIVQCLCSAVPPALFGLPVLALCEKLRWARRGRIAFFPIHLSALVVFSIAWCLSTLFLLSLLSYSASGRWIFGWWDNLALLWQLFSGAMAYLTIASAGYVRQINQSLRLEEQRSAELELRTERAEAARNQAQLAALRAQLNPHFLFNTLHSLMALIRSDTEMAEEAVERFAAMLRYVLHSHDEKSAAGADVQFSEEWNFVRNYLELERLRLGERLDLETSIEPAALNFQLPAFTLQPIVENAVRHSIAARAQGGKLFIAARIDERGDLSLEVTDDGPATKSDRQFELHTNQTPAENGNGSSGFGLRLVRETLAARYGDEAALTIAPERSKNFTVRITIPPRAETRPICGIKREPTEI